MLIYWQKYVSAMFSDSSPLGYRLRFSYWAFRSLDDGDFSSIRMQACISSELVIYVFPIQSD